MAVKSAVRRVERSVESKVVQWAETRVDKTAARKVETTAATTVVTMVERRGDLTAAKRAASLVDSMAGPMDM